MSDHDDTNLTGECQRTMRLLEMQRRTHYDLVQENGQRRLTAPEVARGERQRGKGAEVFLGRLPRDCYEDELMPLLEQVGRLLELRLMLDFSGSTRGYAFALFEDSRVARMACERLDGYEIRRGHRIGVVKSMDNCRLFFGGVPKTKTKPEFMKELTKILDGIMDIYVYPSAQDRNLNRGFIFVEFKDHRAAAMARRKLIPGKVMLWDHEIAVDWADPEPGDPIDEDIMETVTALFVRNLALDMSQQKVREILYRYTDVPILKLKKINHFAFVHYENREAAKTVMDIMEKPDSIVEKQGWEIRWAKPIGASKILERARYIREAVTNSRVQKTEKPCSKERKKRSSKMLTKTHEDKSVYLAQMKTLQSFVEERFDATCIFDCIQILDASGYIGRVIVRKGEFIMCEFQGEPVASKHKAMSEASIKVYQYLTSMFPNNAPQLFEQHYIVSGMDINPVIGTPIVWHPVQN
ncbi:PREDICTED: APOBEC1 complementation factor-like [Trachymyrmex cornetzi]|uniref:APOBEC1 complementation factor n=1 Tax=Trachymyrmex cornetzi TaxID=471704 RepID=A0A151J7S8_9HYME|nr:PREDICTED: APOBEC1 complementation factor-like [Trachymyrmex cornetzi]KYN20032.1 APOBEC1 complementation factor [Trachymyrmex cornetzi]